MELPRMRRYQDVWVATYKGFTARAVCPVWAYCAVKELARCGFNHFDGYN